jgi:putative transposase
VLPNPYRGFRFPPVVIEHAVWLYHCFSLSLRDVELILAARGIVVSYESIREWGLRFRQYAEAAPATTGRQVVHARGVHPHPR